MRMQDKRILYNPSNKQFYVNYTEQGKPKRKYLGKGKNKSDRVGQRKAKAALKVWADERELAESQARMHLHYKAVLEGTKPIDSLPPAIAQLVQQAAQAPPKPQPAPKQIADMTADELEEYLEQPESLEAQAQRQLLYSRSAAARIARPKKGKPTVAVLVAEWLKTEKLRVAADQLTATAHRDKTNGIKQFSEHVNGDCFNGNVEDVLMSYRAKLLTKLAAGEYSGNTVNDKLKFTRQFINWCYENRKLDEMPRCMSSFCKRVEVEKGGKPVALADICKLWAKAGDRMKCFIAIALNTGMKNGDIAALKGSNVHGVRLIGKRPKTGVPFNVKLWPVTVQLIEKCRDNQGDDEHLFNNTKGEPIKSDVISSLFKKVTAKAEVLNGTTRNGKPRGATFEQLRDTSAELVRKSLIASGADRGLLQVFLQHKDKSTAAYYVSDAAEDIQSDKLDEITDQLGKQYGLKL